MINVCLITRNFYPLKGGMERLNECIHEILSARYETHLFGPKGCESYVKKGIARGSRISPSLVFLASTFFKAFVHACQAKRIDVFFAGSGVVAPLVVMFAKLFRARSIVLIHGLDIIVESYIYQLCFIPFIKRADLVVSNSANTTRLAVEKGISAAKITVINPGSEALAFRQSKQEARSILGARNVRLLLSVGRLIPRKGLAEFIRHSLPILVEDDPTIEFWIAGTEPTGALKKNEFSVLQEINEVIEKSGLQKNVRLLGRVDEEQLNLLYQAADVFILPLKEVKGDVEGFGMVAVEAAAYGTPTVAFDCGGVRDAIITSETGFIVEPENYQAFANNVKRAMSELDRDTIVKFSENFSWERYGTKLYEQIENLMKEDSRANY